MKIGKKIRAIREAKGLSQKEVSLSIDMDPSQYSRIEKDKTDPTCSTLERVASALGVDVAELFGIEPRITSTGDLEYENSFDKSILEKVKLLAQLTNEEQTAIFQLIDSLVTKYKLKLTLKDALNLAS
jgi:transcriptional regulator with XRE-family HTH domain